jgi:hypothetical protein
MFWKHRSTTCRDWLLTQVPKKAALLPGFHADALQKLRFKLYLSV